MSRLTELRISVEKYEEDPTHAEITIQGALDRTTPEADAFTDEEWRAADLYVAGILGRLGVEAAHPLVREGLYGHHCASKDDTCHVGGDLLRGSEPAVWLYVPSKRVSVWLERISEWLAEIAEAEL